jgi:hypothetical protein
MWLGSLWAPLFLLLLVWAREKGLPLLWESPWPQVPEIKCARTFRSHCAPR